jgi:hypothetical protein
MKKFIVFAVVLALLVPSLAMAATEFSLGGFIKLDAMWDSDNGVGKNINAVPARNNSDSAKHGRLKFTAQGSRFSFTIKGPDLWGAKTTGFIEMDFDAAENGLTASSGNSTTAVLGTPQGVAFGGASKSYTPRLRHAMFRFNWPTSELLFGQYWSMFCEYFAESAEDGPLQMTGTPTARMAQIRFTQTFSGFTVAALVGDPNQSNLVTSTTGQYNAAINNGQIAESPQVQGKISYAQDLWGKAAFYGKPTPFTIQAVGGWQRNHMRTATGVGVFAFGQDNFVAGITRVPARTVNPWMGMGTLFIPVIPTHTANLAGTASILLQGWIGAGVDVFGFTGIAGNKYRYEQNILGATTYEADLLNKFGGFGQAQYYFTNQWYVNALYAFSKAYNVDRSRNRFGINTMEMAFTNANEASTIQQVEATLWYRPIQAIKFGLQYSYTMANYFQITTVPALTSHSSRFGNDHRVEFVGFFYF